jgi:hypothetical protein
VGWCSLPPSFHAFLAEGFGRLVRGVGEIGGGGSHSVFDGNFWREVVLRWGVELMRRWKRLVVAAASGHCRCLVGGVGGLHGGSLDCGFKDLI